MNIDTKLIPKVLAERLKKVLSSLISKNQTVYVKGRFIKGGRLISDILEISDNLKTKGFLMTLDIEKTFNLVNHLSLITALEKYAFKEDFIKWVQILIQRILNLESHKNLVPLMERQQQTISRFKEVPEKAIQFYTCFRNCIFIDYAKRNINGPNILENTFLYTVYADDTTLNDKKSVKELMKIFDILTFSGLKPNKSKCEIAGLGAL